MKAIRQFENAYGIKLTRNMHIELLALLLCLEEVLAFSYIGYIEIPPISVTTLHILVIVAAMMFGPWDAAAVALVFAGTSMWKASVTSIEIGDIIFSPSLSGKPFESIIMAAGTRIAFAIIAGFIFRWFFSRRRKHTYTGIAVISIVSTLLHSLFVYICMVVFFDAAAAETSAGFDRALILNNLILFAVTVAVVLLCHRMIKLPAVRDFFEKTSLNAKENAGKRSRVKVLAYVLITLSLLLIVMHFLSRLSLYINAHGENAGAEYILWTYALILQFIVAFAGVFGILSLSVRWIQEYYASLTLEANIRARENAEIANRSKSAFLFNMSHDIRTPMNAILGYTDIALRHGDEPERVKDSLVKIKTSGRHLLSLINDILEMSRIESGKLVLAENPLDIRTVIENVAGMCRELAVSKDIDLDVNCGEIKNPYIYADELHANEVIINLISNAVKYTNPGGKIEYTVNQIGGVTDGKVKYRFVIADNGIGMSEEFQQHLFETFSRERTSTVSKQEGTGLGLSIVKNIVDMSGGTIRVESKLGEGTAFTIEVPFRVMDGQAVEAFVKENRAAEPGGENMVFGGRKILLVEDNEMNREIAAEILADAGFEVETAEDGKIAVDRVRDNGSDYYDFILMDIQMPVMNGYEATAAIRALPGGGKMPIIALSANAFREDVEKSAAAGMDAHVAKPINIETLIDTMRRLTK